MFCIWCTFQDEKDFILYSWCAQDCFVLTLNFKVLTSWPKRLLLCVLYVSFSVLMDVLTLLLVMFLCAALMAVKYIRWHRSYKLSCKSFFTLYRSVHHYKTKKFSFSNSPFLSSTESQLLSTSPRDQLTHWLSLLGKFSALQEGSKLKFDIILSFGTLEKVFHCSSVL